VVSYQCVGTMGISQYNAQGSKWMTFRRLNFKCGFNVEAMIIGMLSLQCKTCTCTKFDEMGPCSTRENYISGWFTVQTLRVLANLAIKRDGSMWRKENSSSVSFFQLLHIPDYITLGHTLRLPLFWVWSCITGDWFLMFWDCCPMTQHQTQEEQKSQLHYYKQLKTHVGNFNSLHSVVLWHINISMYTIVKLNKLLLNSSVIATCFLVLESIITQQNT
jgi:hypothetical protein